MIDKSDKGFDESIFSRETAQEKYFEDVMEDNGLPRRQNIDWCNKIYRFGLINPYDAMQSGREYLFFIKPDLFIVHPNTKQLMDNLKSSPFFVELQKKWPHIILQLQYQADPYRTPFSYLLTNAVTSHLDLPSLSATTISTPVNNFGTSYDYRGTSEASDDNFTFSLEFNDTKYLDVYMYFRAYEEYQILRAQGRISLKDNELYRSYITTRTLHDQIGIYKFIVGDDMETILHYSYYCGVIWTSLPRDSFNTPDFDDGIISYAVDGKAAFVEDMNPLILSDFNNLVHTYNVEHTKKTVSVYDEEIHRADLRPVLSPFIVSDVEKSTGKKVYKLKFRR